MLSSRGQPRDDEQPVPGIRIEQLDPASVDAVIARLRTSRPYAFKDLDRLAVALTPARLGAQHELAHVLQQGNKRPGHQRPEADWAHSLDLLKIFNGGG